MYIIFSSDSKSFFGSTILRSKRSNRPFVYLVSRDVESKQQFVEADHGGGDGAIDGDRGYLIGHWRENEAR